MRDKLGTRKIFIIVGHLGEIIKGKFRDGSDFGVDIQYIECPNFRAGLAKGISLAKDLITSNFVVILGDEFYLNTNHEELVRFANSDFDAVCGVKITTDTQSSKRIIRLILLMTE